MNIKPVQRNAPQGPKKSKKTLSKGPKQKASTLNAPPDNRHHWDPDKAKWVRRLRDVVLPMVVRVDDQNFDKIPKDGSVIVGPTHQNYLDALIASRVPEEPHGSMSDVNQFKGPMGTLLSNYGSFPVDRWEEYEGDFPDPVDHTVDILNGGHNFIFYPEGRIYPDAHVHPLKTGIGRIAMASNAKYALPVAQNYVKDTKAQPGETLIGLGLTAAITGLGFWAATQSGLASGVAGGLTGLVSGAVLGGGAAYFAGSREHQQKAIGRALKGAAAGALTLGIAGAGASTFAPTVAPMLVKGTTAVTGLLGLGATYWSTHRPVAQTRIGDPIELEPYRERARNSEDPKAEWKESLKLTADFHEALKKEKTVLTGIETPYKMDYEGNRWGKQDDGSWVKVERNEKREWVPIEDAKKSP